MKIWLDDQLDIPELKKRKEHAQEILEKKSRPSHEELFGELDKQNRGR